MKYLSELPEETNRQRWLCAAQTRGGKCSYDKLSEVEHFAARSLNKCLAALEGSICRQIEPLLAELLRRKGDPSDDLEDFDITLTLRYQLEETDPEWEQFDGNLLCVQSLSLYEISDPTITAGFGRAVADFSWAGWPGEVPCWTFIDLIESSGLDWSDLCRVAGVQTSLAVKLDYETIVSGVVRPA